jgi:hypothetical protein
MMIIRTVFTDKLRVLNNNYLQFIVKLINVFYHQYFIGITCGVFAS